jgi:hypothetical protein
MAWDKEKMETLKQLVIATMKGLRHTAVPFYLYSYAPTDEIVCLREFDIMAKELQYQGYSVDCHYLSQLLIEALQNLNYLDEETLNEENQTFLDIEENLRTRLPKELVSLLSAALKGDRSHCTILLRAGSLYPFVHPSTLLSQMEAVIYSTVVLPFPGRKDGPMLGDLQYAGRSYYHGTWL